MQGGPIAPKRCSPGVLPGARRVRWRCGRPWRASPGSSFFTAMSLLPPVPGVPMLRQFQADQGAVARAWQDDYAACGLTAQRAPVALLIGTGSRDME
jgi:hypothetical protein